MSYHLDIFAQTMEEVVEARNFLQQQSPDAFASYDISPEPAVFPKDCVEAQDYKFGLRLTLNNPNGGIQHNEAIARLAELFTSLSDCKSLSDEKGLGVDSGSGTSGQNRRVSFSAFLVPPRHTITLIADKAEDVRQVRDILRREFSQSMKNYNAEPSGEETKTSQNILVLEFSKNGREICSTANKIFIGMYRYLRQQIPALRFSMEECEVGGMERNRVCRKNLLIESRP